MHVPYINQKINNYIGYTNVGIELKVWGWLSDKKAFVHIVNVYIMFIFAVVSFISIHLNFRGNSSKIYKHLRHDTRTTSKSFILKDSYSIQNTSVLYR